MTYDGVTDEILLFSQCDQLLYEREVTERQTHTACSPPDVSVFLNMAYKMISGL